MFTGGSGTRSERRQSHAFTALTYNILARSLGSNCIPWVMQVSEESKLRVEAAQGRSWEAWRRGAVDDEYKRHWHKNFASGDYTAMRRLWSGAVLGPEDVPAELRGLAFEAEDEVRYERAGASVVATTLRGVLRASLGDEAGVALWEELSESEATVYDWRARGPKVFGVAASADVVALQEYDVHGVVADYDAGPAATFAEAMGAAGFDGVFAKDPLRTRKPPSGLGVFWRRGVFEACEGDGGVLDLDCGEAAGSLSNHDLEETWHPLSAAGEEVPLPAADRRTQGRKRVRHWRTSKAPISVVFRSFRLIFGRVIIPRNGLEA